MLTIFRLLFSSLRSSLRSHAALQAEILALQHQLLVLQRSKQMESHLSQVGVSIFPLRLAGDSWQEIAQELGTSVTADQIVPEAGASLYQILQILSLTLFEKTPILCALQAIHPDANSSEKRQPTHSLRLLTGQQWSAINSRY